jgi:hypothetical protein
VRSDVDRGLSRNRTGPHVSILSRLAEWIRNRRARKRLTWIPVDDVPESRKSNWFAGRRTVQDEDAQKMRGHRSR